MLSSLTGLPAHFILEKMYQRKEKQNNKIRTTQGACDLLLKMNVLIIR